MLDLVRALGWLDPARYLDSPRATVEQLTRYHTLDYVAALRQAEEDQAAPAEVRERHHIGAHGNPVYREVFRRPATSAGGAILAARLTRGGGIVHVPGAVFLAIQHPGATSTPAAATCRSYPSSSPPRPRPSLSSRP